MDKYTKGVLTVIAVSLVLINFQLSSINIINKASAHDDNHYHYSFQIFDLEDHSHDYADSYHSHDYADSYHSH